MEPCPTSPSPAISLPNSEETVPLGTDEGWSSDGGPEEGIVRRPSPVHGFGVFAMRPFKKGDRIIEYKGRVEKWGEQHHGFEGYAQLFHAGPGFVINPAVDGNIARFINHSCDPNCEAILEGRRVFIEATRDIAAGEELFIDYALALGRRFTKQDVLDYRCRCGAPNCRGTMLHVPPHRLAQVRRWVSGVP